VAVWYNQAIANNQVLLEKRKKMAAKIYSATTSVEIPKYNLPKSGESWKDHLEQERKSEIDYIRKLRAFAKTRKPNGKNVGEVVGFPMADGFAFYMVLSMRPLELMHIPLGDAYQFPYANRLTAKDIESKINSRRVLAMR
jgi:hypothetical protein